MKATFNLPDKLYREVKARSALEGKPVREIVITLFQQWLGQHSPRPEKNATDWQRFAPPLRHLVPPNVTDHSMDSIRGSISRNFDDTI